MAVSAARPASLWANVSTTVAATMTVLVGMFLLGLFIAFGTYVVSWSDSVKRELMGSNAYRSASADRSHTRFTNEQ